ncbi:MAG: extracellular solute-binding protein [Betaproteobacteria bacterium]|nr:extracellular solute-binding protein [Betaproteobacteria bacterium]
MTFTRRSFARTSLSLAALACSGAALSQSASQTVTIYTSAPSEIQKALVPAIRAKLGLEVQLVSAGGGELMKRLRAERARPLADLVVSTGGDVIDANPDLFEPYAVRELDQINKAYRVSPHWTPFTVTIPTVLLVNTRLVPAAEMPSRWADLADPKWKGKIAFAGADKSSSALTQMLQIIYNEGEQKGWALFEAMFKNFVVTGSSSAVARGTAQGEYAMAITLEDYGLNYLEGGAPVRVVYPSEGINSSADAMALVRGAPNAAGAKAVLDFLASAEGQTLMVKASGRRPVRADVRAAAGGPELSKLNVKTYPQDWANAQQKGYLARYQQMVRR